MRDAAFDYIPRNLEQTTLYPVVSKELETFLRRQEERDRPVPRFVEGEFRSFLDCGILARGFLRLRCQSCGHDWLLAFSYPLFLADHFEQFRFRKHVHSQVRGSGLDVRLRTHRFRTQFRLTNAPSEVENRATQYRFDKRWNSQIPRERETESYGSLVKSKPLQDAKTAGLPQRGRVSASKLAIQEENMEYLRQQTRFVTWRRALPILAILLFTTTAFGQNYTGDARRIGMGGTGENQNIGSELIDEQHPYRSIVIPLGLIQVVQDRRYFNPNDDSFNPARALEDAANPLHVTLRRGASTAHFVDDVINARFSRDLNSYRGFVPAKEIIAQGLLSPSFGHLFRFKRTPEGGFNGIYVGAGPYISAKTALNVDDRLRQVLASNQDVRVPNTSFQIRDQSAGQAALAITVGYRGRLALLGSSSSESRRNGIYIAGNYHYLRGFRFDSADLQVRFDTDSGGLITLNPTVSPALADHLYSNRGNGYAVDIGVGAVVNRWQFGVGSNGIGNRIEWDSLRLERYALQSLFNGGNFVRQALPSSTSTTRVELPVDTNADVRYNGGSWAALAQAGHGYHGNIFHAGGEKRLGPIEVRGGARFSRDMWHPAVGLGFDLSNRFAIDVAATDSTANIQRMRKAIFAVSLRFNHEAKEN